MSSAGTRGGNSTTRRWSAFTFWRWVSLFLIPYGVGHAILVLLVGIALGLRVRSLLLPYLLLLWCGFVGGSLIYWARQSYDRPRAGAARFTLAVFVLLNLYMGVLVFGACDVGLLSQQVAISGYAPYILPTAVIASVVGYPVVRRRLEAFLQSSSGAAQ